MKLKLILLITKRSRALTVLSVGQDSKHRPFLVGFSYNLCKENNL